MTMIMMRKVVRLIHTLLLLLWSRLQICCYEMLVTESLIMIRTLAHSNIRKFMTVHTCMCTAVICYTGSIRLIGGSSRLSGTIEMCVSNQWQRICYENWDISDATVACRQLGFSETGGNAFCLHVDIECKTCLQKKSRHNMLSSI